LIPPFQAHRCDSIDFLRVPAAKGRAAKPRKSRQDADPHRNRLGPTDDLTPGADGG